MQSAKDALADARQALWALAVSNRERKKWGDNLSVNQPVDAALVEIDRKLHGQPSPQSVMDLADMADDMRCENTLLAADQIYQKILPLEDILDAQQKDKLTGLLVHFANDCATAGSVEAEPYYKKAMELTSKSKGPRSAELAELIRTLGLFYKSHGQIALAEQTLMDALAVAQAAQGEHGQLVTTLYDDLGEVYRAEKDFDRATEMFKLSERLKNK